MKKIRLILTFSLGLFASVQPLSIKAQTVSTLAGSGTLGYVDGTGTSASFNNPWGVYAASNGDVYVSDTYNHVIRKITLSGVVTTFVGSGVAGGADGTGTAATFNGPSGICGDLTGNLFVIDYFGNKIRKITPAGDVTTIAGSGSAGFANGNGTAASFSAPYDICIDSDGNLYVTDATNHSIRKITQAGDVTTFAGLGTPGSQDGTTSNATFSNPLGIAIDGANNIYICDVGNSKIRKITAAGVVSTLAGTGTGGSADGPGSAATFYNNFGLCVDANGNLYVADSYNNKIRKILPDGTVSTYAGTGTAGMDNGGLSTASFDRPHNICIDALGNFYIADTFNRLIRKITTSFASIDENNQVPVFSLAPNPTSSIITLTIDEPIVSVTVFNVLGEQVLSETHSTFSVASLPSGVYLIQLQTQKGIAMQRFVKN